MDSGDWALERVGGYWVLAIGGWDGHKALGYTYCGNLRLGAVVNETDAKAAGRTFDTAAEQYEAYRPGYPDALVQAVISLTGIRPGDTILEIGSGTGKATEPFALRGFEMLCVEPGENLVAISRRKFRGFPNVAFEVATFEDWEVRGRKFDMVMAAQSIHWVEEAARYAKTASVLRDGGHWADFWNANLPPEGEVRHDIDKAHEEFAPELAGPKENLEDVIRQAIDEIEGSGYYGKVQVRRFPWTARYETEAFIGGMGTHSGHLLLPEDRRHRLFQAVREAVDRHGGYVVNPFVAVLLVARKLT